MKLLIVQPSRVVSQQWKLPWPELLFSGCGPFRSRKWRSDDDG